MGHINPKGSSYPPDVRCIRFTLCGGDYAQEG